MGLLISLILCILVLNYLFIGVLISWKCFAHEIHEIKNPTNFSASTVFTTESPLGIADVNKKSTGLHVQRTRVRLRSESDN